MSCRTGGDCTSLANRFIATLTTNNTGAQTRRGPLRETNGGAGRKDKHVGILEHEGGRHIGAGSEASSCKKVSRAKRASEGKKLRK